MTVVLVGAVLALVGCRAGGQGSTAPPGTGVASDGAAAGVQPNRFFDPASFAQGLREVQAAPPPARDGRLAGGVVPHHALAGAMLSTFFIQLEAHPPTTVIVVGPNHPLRGQRVITGRRGWATDFGTVAANGAVVDRLVAAGLAVVDDEVLAEEHSVGALMPYLKYHAPKATVVPLILHKDLTLSELEHLAGALEPMLSPDTLLIASVDFSHYLTRAQAEAKDVETWRAIQAFDQAELLRMQPDHMDSPLSLLLVMLTMRMHGTTGPTVEGNTNSGVLMDNDRIETTSYFVITYRKD